MTELSRDEAERFVEAVVQLTSMADRVLPGPAAPLARRLSAHLGGDVDDVSTTSMSVPIAERVNVQLALNAYADSVDRFDVIGLQSEFMNYGNASLAALLTGSWRGPGESALQYVALGVDVDETIECLQAGLVLTEVDGSPVVALVYGRDMGVPQVVVEVVGADPAAAAAFVERLRDLMHEHNAYRGKTVSFTFGMRGDFGLDFVTTADVARDDVVLAPGELEAIEAHAIGISEHAEELRVAGQHVKRGLLLYGPPGTGKTHTISYLTGRMHGRTTIILSGGAVAAVGQAGTIARSLQPATIIIEDVDLIALDRQLPGGEHNAPLFQLLNEMDGLAEDADVLFILTTNQVEVLEPALAARPGRIDQAIEISLPDAAARRRLLELYVNQPVSDGAETDSLIARLDGVAPAFIKELARRAHLVQIAGHASAENSLSVALDRMLEQATPVLRRTLAGPADSESVG